MDWPGRWPCTRATVRGVRTSSLTRSARGPLACASAASATRMAREPGWDRGARQNQGLYYSSIVRTTLDCRAISCILILHPVSCFVHLHRRWRTSTLRSHVRRGDGTEKSVTWSALGANEAAGTAFCDRTASTRRAVCLPLSARPPRDQSRCGSRNALGATG